MQLSIISGSQRHDSNSHRVATIIADLVTTQQHFRSAPIIDLATAPLPLFDPAHPSAGQWPSLSAQLQASEALVVISPEWHGMVPSGLKNLLLYCTTNEVGHKPALLVTVSSGVGGSYPVAELRISGYKNNRLLWLPDQVIIRQVAHFIQAYPNASDEIQKNLQGRLAYGLCLLHEYAKALLQVRQSERFNLALYANGM